MKFLLSVLFLYLAFTLESIGYRIGFGFLGLSFFLKSLK